MNRRIVFRNMGHSDAIDAYAHKELDKVTKFLQKEDDAYHLDLVLDAAKTHAHHKVELRLNSKHYLLIASHEGADLYLEIDHVIKTMVQEIKKHKEKALDKRNHPNTKKVLFEEDEEQFEEKEFEDQ